jgi:dimethylamine/trimethylamine dehydrogenase
MSRDPKYDVLFEPLKIGPKTMKNRFWQVPHCNTAGTTHPGTNAGHRGMKAEGGWAVISTEACSIDPMTSMAPATLASLWDEGDIINLRHMCDAVHEHGSLAAVELMHSGAVSTGLASRNANFAVSEMTTDWTIATYAHEMDEDDILAVENMYCEAAKKALQAGFDVIYFYGSHGLLPAQFLSKFYNKRTDKYGGPFENRVRFWMETLQKMRETVDGQAAVAVRITVDQLMGDEGIQCWDEPVKFAELATKEGLVDVWDVNMSNFTEWGEDAGPSRFQKANHQRPFTKYIREVVKTPTLNVGRLTSPDDMVEIINSGQADIIGGARPTIADPFLPKKIEEGRNEDIRECIGCNQCISRWERGTPIVCTQNPPANEEYRRNWHPEKFDKTPNPCSVLVVGAGPAGLECARVLGERGYDVHLAEAEKEVGGHMRDVIRYPGLAEWGRLITYRETQLDKLKNVEVHTGTGLLSADDVLKYGADKVVLCTGSRWRDDGYSHNTMAPIKGIDGKEPQFVTPEQVMAGKEIGDRVIVLDADGYFTGVSLAEYIVDQGKDVSIVTHYGAVGPLTEFTLEAVNLHRMMHEKGIKQYTSHWVEDIDVGNLVKVRIFDLYRDGYQRTTEPGPDVAPRRMGDETTELECDTVVLATGRTANNQLYKDLRARKDQWEREGIQAIYQAGDCYAPRVISEVVFDGHRIAREFDMLDPQTPQLYIRERMIWGMDPRPTLHS